ncbi:MAG: amidohydrolase family protein [Methanoregula sp.]|jgi:cytosine/adenosine deaminase-related metal-dependent hydrolase
MKTTRILSGMALVGEKLAAEPVDIEIQNGIITAIEENKKAPNFWICPAFFNAHTHLADTLAMDCRHTGSLAELVTPPDGLKHRILNAASPEELTGAIRASITGMIAGGTAGCADFREGGVPGVRLFHDAASGLPFFPVVFGRDGGENEAMGLGISSTRDVPNVETQVSAARKAGKKIAFHAGERDAGDVDAALSFDPDLLIHMTHATDRQIRECAEKNIPIAVCPRSNWILGVSKSPDHPPLARMILAGCRLFLGTDNAMFVPPDMFSEMAFAATVYGLDPGLILHAAVAGSELRECPFFIRKGARANLIIIDPAQSALRFSKDPVKSIVNRAPATLRGNNVFNL